MAHAKTDSHLSASPVTGKQPAKSKKKKASPRKSVSGGDSEDSTSDFLPEQSESEGEEEEEAGVVILDSSTASEAEEVQVKAGKKKSVAATAPKRKRGAGKGKGDGGDAGPNRGESSVTSSRGYDRGRKGV